MYKEKKKQNSRKSSVRGAASSREAFQPKRIKPMQRRANNTGMPDQLKSEVESLSGLNMDDVKVHYNSSKPAAVQAHAYTQGSDIHIAPGQQEHLAHEAWHVVQQKQGRVKPTTEHNGVSINDSKSLEQEADVMGAKANSSSGSFNSSTVQKKLDTVSQKTILQKTQTEGEEFGQSSTGNTRHLISDLSSPIVVGSEPRFELIQHGSELWATDTEITYRWTITDLTSGNIVFQVTTNEPETRFEANIPGNYEVNVSVLGDGEPAATSISMKQAVVPEDGFLTTSLSSSSLDEARTYRELINDFRTYIIDAANSTGSNGITPLFLASVLFIEVFNRPKEGRESEIEGVGEAIGELQRENWLYPWQVVDRSIGVGQIRLSTAAMVTGATPWIDQEPGNRQPTRNLTEANFEALSADEKATIYQLLRWPKSNILMAARLLTTLKNRANRFPTLTKGDFATNQNAVGVVASEYNLGPSDTSAVDARPSWYGRNVWNSMNTDAILIHYFPNS